MSMMAHMVLEDFAQNFVEINFLEQLEKVSQEKEKNHGIVINVIKFLKLVQSFMNISIKIMVLRNLGIKA